MYPTVELPIANLDLDELLKYVRTVFWPIMVTKHTESSPGAKGPGYPWSKIAGPTNKAVFLNYGNELLNSVCDRLTAMSGPVNQSISASEMVDINITDPVRMFVKNELHPEAKCKEGRFRLIFNCSITDILIETLIWEPLFSKNIENWTSQPSLPGIGFDDVGYKKVVEIVSNFQNPHTADVRGMDWSMKGIDFERMLHVWSTNSGIPINSVLYNVMAWRIKALSLSMVVNSDGIMIEQVIPGIMKSGSKATSQGDSLTVVAWGLEIGVSHTRSPIEGSTYFSSRIPSPIVAMGDDSIQEYVEGAEAKYLGLGVVVTDYQAISPEDFEFCGHFMGTKRPIELVRWEKSLAEHFHRGYNSVDEKYVSWAGIRTELRNSLSTIDFIEGLFVALDWWSET